MKHRDTKFHFNDNLTITTDASGNQTISGSGTGGGQDNLSDNFNGTYIYQDDAGNMHTAVDSGQDNENYTTNWSQSYPSMNVTQSDNDPVSDSWTYVVDGNTLSQGGYSVNYGNEGNSGGSTQATYDPDDLGGVGQDFPGASFNTAGTSSFGQWPPAASPAQPTAKFPPAPAGIDGVKPGTPWTAGKGYAGQPDIGPSGDPGPGWNAWDDGWYYSPPPTTPPGYNSGSPPAFPTWARYTGAAGIGIIASTIGLLPVAAEIGTWTALGTAGSGGALGAIGAWFDQQQ